MTKRVVLIDLRLFFGVLILVAIGTQLIIQVQIGYSVVNFFSFFTNLSNLFAAFVLLRGAARLIVRQAPSARDDVLRTAAAVYMTVVGIVYMILLRNVDLGSLLPWVNTVLHYIMPVVVVAEWLFQPPTTKLRARRILTLQLFPFIYLIYVLVRGSITSWYPYPFLNPLISGGYRAVAGYVVGILVLFVIVSWAALTVGNKSATEASTQLPGML